MEDRAYFSPYSSVFGSPLSPGGPSHAAAPWPRDSDQKTPAADEGEEGERIEMMGVDVGGWQGNVAPVLQHPGKGRAALRGLTEEDAKRGYAL